MIRHIGNAAAHHLTLNQAARPVKNASTETNPFRSVLSATEDGPATTTASSTSAAPLAAFSKESKGVVAKAVASPALGQTPVKIQATVTKPASNTVVLSAPVFEQGGTVTNPDGSTTPLNWNEFANGATAEQIAAKLGGTVDTSSVDGFSVQQRGIRVPGSDNLINAGIAAKLFAQYGDKQGSLAWQVINRDLGRDPMAT